ncbi:MAG: phosphate regulon sensor histidine kinase PhoR [Gammaproteobacteria bacterium]|nr:phosphate regulon sensor histidine kinase PhoR [Gammaproteobacteria bacterium]
MINPWTSELFRLAGWVAVATFIGALFGRSTLAALIAITLYLAWSLRNLRYLERWLESRGKATLPSSRGIWAEVFDQLYLLQKRARERQKRLTGYLSRYQESTSAMPDATIVLNDLGQIEWFNPPAQQLFNLHNQKDRGQYIGNLIRNPAFNNYLDAGNFSSPIEIHPLGNEQEFVSIRIVQFGQNQQLLIARNITRIRKLENMRRDFVANISHELRTPLTVLNGYLETMQDDSDDALKPWRRSLQLMQQQTSRMENIVKDLLVLTRLETEPTAQETSDVHVPAILNQILQDALALSGDQHHQISLDADPSLELRGVPNELHSAFSNLIFNAVRYTPAQGRINIRWYRDSSGAHLTVQDTGIGIPAQHIPRLTERFYRVDTGRSRETGGTGLGLAIVKHVLQRHQGQLRIVSVINQGSTFSCDFPNSQISSVLDSSAEKIRSHS